MKHIIKKVMLACLCLNTAPVFAEDCAITVTTNDQMQYDIKTMEISKSCPEFTIHLTHTGSIPRTAMGHNVVISKTADKIAVAQDGLSAGLEHQYVKPNDSRVIAHTDIIGGGEKTAVTFNTEQLTTGEDYSFFCSFPGHVFMMQGTVNVTEK